jgi:hypothetical protein
MRQKVSGYIIIFSDRTRVLYIFNVYYLRADTDFQFLIIIIINMLMPALMTVLHIEEPYWYSITPRHFGPRN